jgi:hypothetical protein
MLRRSFSRRCMQVCVCMYMYVCMCVSMYVCQCVSREDVEEDWYVTEKLFQVLYAGMCVYVYVCICSACMYVSM